MRREREVSYSFDNERPIYVQLVEKIRLDIISGKLKSGEKIPSVREFALEARVNPNTMQKALVEREEEGLLYTERTNGKYVTDNKKLIERIKKELAEEKVNIFLEDMKNIGIESDEIISYLKDIGGDK